MSKMNNNRKIESDSSESEGDVKKVSVGALETDEQQRIDDADWGDVYEACCVHTSEEWGWVFVGVLTVIFFLYWFMFSLELLGSSAKVLTGCSAGALFGDDTNPVAGVMVGIIGTVLLQSSSTSTSIVVTLTGSAISLNQGIYMIMGANIGTTVTNTLVSLAQIGDHDQLEQAFAGATVHDMFNYMTVAILFPVELVTNYLARITAVCVKGVQTSKGDEWEGPVKKIVAPLADKIIKSNSKLIRAVAQGNKTCETGGGFYPIVCEPGTPTYKTCTSVGLIPCEKESNECPLLFQPDATAADDKISGGVMLFISIVLLFVCLGVLVYILSKMLGAVSGRVIYKCSNINGYLAICIGCGLTVLVQSSSVVTSALTPLVGMGAIRLEQMYPLTLGSNIGTTITGILAALVSVGTTPLQVALAHLFFNVTGIIIFYPIPFMREFPMGAARFLGRMTQLWRGFPFLYIFLAFIVIPGIFLGLSFMFSSDSKGLVILGAILLVVLVLGAAWFVYSFKYRGGREKFIKYFAEREKKRAAYASIPQDIAELKENVSMLMGGKTKTLDSPVPDDVEEGLLSEM